MGQDTIFGEGPRLAMSFEPGYQFEDGIERYRIVCHNCGYASASVAVDGLDQLQGWMEDHTCLVADTSGHLNELWRSLAHRAYEDVETILVFLAQAGEGCSLPLDEEQQLVLRLARGVLYRGKDREVRRRGA